MKEWRRAKIKVPRGSESQQPWKYWLAVPLNGTTFSGHSTKTTLGNTLRSIMYMYYYIWQSGVPWNWKTFDLDYPVEASGDDTVAYVRDRETALTITSMIREMCHTEKVVENEEDRRRGLGQIVPEIVIGHWTEQEFCSKWVFCSGTVESIGMYRNVRKVLFSRCYYTGSNAKIRNNPHIHAEAIYLGFKSEKTSRLVEDILKTRVK